MKVSAYVPCYNAGSTVSEAVRSILEQTSPVEEVFVVDDGSADGPDSVNALKVVKISSNSGRGAARARAMAEAKYELVLGCDATLRLDRNFLERALPWFENPKVAAVFGWVNEAALSTAANRWRGRHLYKSDIPKSISREANLAAGCFVVRKSLVEQIGGFNPSLAAGEDFDLGQRLLNAGFDVVFDPALFACSYLENSLWEVLERYARWNSPDGMGLRDYLRQMNYAFKVMVPADLRAKDLPGAFISLLSPHYQFWTRRPSKCSDDPVG
jgi:glycosyltransferase involved in cell wall biosynthesis